MNMQTAQSILDNRDDNQPEPVELNESIVNYYVNILLSGEPIHIEYKLERLDIAITAGEDIDHCVDYQQLLIEGKVDKANQMNIAKWREIAADLIRDYIADNNEYPQVGYLHTAFRTRSEKIINPILSLDGVAA